MIEYERSILKTSFYTSATDYHKNRHDPPPYIVKSPHQLFKIYYNSFKEIIFSLKYGRCIMLMIKFYNFFFSSYIFVSL